MPSNLKNGLKNIPQIESHNKLEKRNPLDVLEALYSFILLDARGRLTLPISSLVRLLCLER